jgi:hypothetical protein
MVWFWEQKKNIEIEKLIDGAIKQKLIRPLVIKIASKDRGVVNEHKLIYCYKNTSALTIPQKLKGKNGEEVVRNYTLAMSSTRPPTLAYFPDKIYENALPVNKYEWLPRYQAYKNTAAIVALIAYTVMWMQFSIGGGGELSWEGLKESFWFPFALGIFIMSIVFYWNTKGDCSADLLEVTQQSEQAESPNITAWTIPSVMKISEYHEFHGWKLSDEFEKGVMNVLASIEENTSERYKRMNRSINKLEVEKLDLSDKVSRTKGSTSLRDSQVMFRERGWTTRMAIFWSAICIIAFIIWG